MCGSWAGPWHAGKKNCAGLACDPVRLRLLSLVASHAGGEACVCEGCDVSREAVRNRSESDCSSDGELKTVRARIRDVSDELEKVIDSAAGLAEAQACEPVRALRASAPWSARRYRRVALVQQLPNLARSVGSTTPAS